MPETPASVKNVKPGKIYFIFSICIFLFWFLGNVIDVYQFAFVGAVFEMLWLPMLVTLFILPVLSLMFWVKEKFIIKSFYLFSFIIFIATILLMIVLK